MGWLDELYRDPDGTHRTLLRTFYGHRGLIALGHVAWSQRDDRTDGFSTVVFVLVPVVAPVVALDRRIPLEDVTRIVLLLPGEERVELHAPFAARGTDRATLVEIPEHIWRDTEGVGR